MTTKTSTQVTKPQNPIGTIYCSMRPELFADEQEDGSFKIVRRLPKTDAEIEFCYPADGPFKLID